MIEAMSLLEKLDKLMEENEQYLKDNNKVCVITGALTWNFKVFPRILSQLKEYFKVPYEFSFLYNPIITSDGDELCKNSRPTYVSFSPQDQNKPVSCKKCIDISTGIDLNHIRTSTGKTLCDDPGSLDYGPDRVPVNCYKCIDVTERDME